VRNKFSVARKDGISAQAISVRSLHLRRSAWLIALRRRTRACIGMLPLLTPLSVAVQDAVKAALK
jgi:hypothetical protein